MGVTRTKRDCNVQPRLGATALGDDNEQPQLKKLAEGLFCVTVCCMYTERA